MASTSRARFHASLLLGSAFFLGPALTAHASDKPTGLEPARIDFNRYTPVLEDDFDAPLQGFDGTSGVWRLQPPRLMTNGPKSVFLSSQTKTSDGKGVGIDPFLLEGGVLTIDSGLIPEGKLEAVRDALRLVDREKQTGQVRYFTGELSLQPTWAQRYGYYEIRARIPAGRGHWPAFWLAPNTKGWPPEIDIFEAYGKGFGKPTDKDNTFNTAVFFDRKSADGKPTQEVEITNPYAGDEAPDRRGNKGGEQFVFHKRINALETFGADIYRDFHVYAAEWTPKEIVFYFGKDRDSLVEVYRTPTPEDLHTPMHVIINDQLSGMNGWWDPEPGYDAETFAPDNKFQVDYVKVFALKPDHAVSARKGNELIVDGEASSLIDAAQGNDTIRPGGGQDMIRLGGGRNEVIIEKGLDNKLIWGFGAADRLVLEGFNMADANDALARLTQVGNDVWLADPGHPWGTMTISLKDAKREDLSQANLVVRWSASRPPQGQRLKGADATGIVQGTGGDDRLTDGGGKRNAPQATLRGGQGDDTYFVYRSDTVIEEQAGEGIDTVFVFTDYALPPHVENIADETARGGHRLAGNSLGNRLEGSKGGSILEGGKGDDLIIAHGKRDRVVVHPGDGHDTVVGFDESDVLELVGFDFDDPGAVQEKLRSWGPDTILELAPDQSVTFRETDRARLTDRNFRLRSAAPLDTRAEAN